MKSDDVEASEPVPVRENGISDSEDTVDKDGIGETPWNWAADEHNPYNWPARRKWAQVGMISSHAFTA